MTGITQQQKDYVEYAHKRTIKPPFLQKSTKNISIQRKGMGAIYIRHVNTSLHLHLPKVTRCHTSLSVPLVSKL